MIFCGSDLKKSILFHYIKRNNIIIIQYYVEEKLNTVKIEVEVQLHDLVGLVESGKDQRFIMGKF